MRRIKFLSFVVLPLFISSCGCMTFSEPEFRGDEKLNFDGVQGREVKFNASAKVYNENCFNLKIKPSTLDLHIEGDYIGKVHLDKKLKLKKRKESTVEAFFTAILEKGALLKAMKYAGRDEIKIRLSGKVKGGVFIFSKKFEINETKTISGANLNFGG